MYLPLIFGHKANPVWLPACCLAQRSLGIVVDLVMSDWNVSQYTLDRSHARLSILVIAAAASEGKRKQVYCMLKYFSTT